MFGSSGVGSPNFIFHVRLFKGDNGVGSPNFILSGSTHFWSTLKSSHTLDGTKNQEETHNEMQVADPIFYLHRNRPRGKDETMSKKQPLAPVASERFFGLGTLISLNVFRWWGWVPKISWGILGHLSVQTGLIRWYGDASPPLSFRGWNDDKSCLESGSTLW